MVDGASTTNTSKSGMDKINESMAKIGTMLGVQKSNSNGSDDSKKEGLIANQAPVATTPPAAPYQLQHMNSAEGQVIAPPTTKTVDMPSDVSMRTGATGSTKPTTPGKTKTAAGAAIANLAAGVDNTINKMNKSFRKLSEKNACAMGDDASDYEAGHTRGAIAADGTTITEYVSIEKKRAPTPKWVYVSGIAVLAALVAIGVSMAVPGSKMNQWFNSVNDDIAASNDPNVSVAFIGNSYLYVNDVPRVMECISKGRITQESVINTGAGLGSLLKQGNGMYELWQTQGALDFWGAFDFKSMMEQYNVDVDEDYELYDYGMCTVPQLLDGYDNYLSYKNQNGIYFDVGTNPCFEDEYYMTIISHKYDREPMYFDYIVLNDQTRRMASEEGREDSLDALIQAYVSLIKNSRAVPILVDTHAFLFDEDAVYDQAYYQQYNEEVEDEDYQAQQDYQNNYGMNNITFDVDISQDIPAFQAAIYEGLYEYVEALKYFLPTKQAPKIAKVGLTYLAIYDDNKSMYDKLFAGDGVHASQHGTYLFACVLYCTMYGHLPMQPHDDFDIRSIFFKSRSMFGNNTGTPSVSDVNYLRYWARKVAVDGFIPSSMVMPTIQRDPAEEERMWWNRTNEYNEANGNQ